MINVRYIMYSSDVSLLHSVEVFPRPPLASLDPTIWYECPGDERGAPPDAHQLAAPAALR